MHTRIIDTLRDFASLEPEWSRLLSRSSLSSPFLAHWWLDAWWKEYATRQDELQVLCCYDDDADALIGVLPTYVHGSQRPLRERWLRFLGDGLGATLLDAIVEPGTEQRVLPAMADFVASTQVGWDVLDLRCMSERSGLMTHLLDALAYAGRRVTTSVSVSCPIAKLPADWELYLRALSKRERWRTRRLRRDLESLGRVAVENIVDVGALPEALDDAMRMFEQSMSRKHGRPYVVSDRYRRFLASVSERLLGGGQLRLMFLTVDDQRVAFWYQIRHRKTMFGYQTGFDDSWASHDVGLALLGYAIEAAIDEGCAVYNLGAGVADYKLRFAPDILESFGVRAYGASTVGSLREVGDRSAAWAKTVIRDLGPRAPLSSLAERRAQKTSWRELNRL